MAEKTNWTLFPRSNVEWGMGNSHAENNESSVWIERTLDESNSTSLSNSACLTWDLQMKIETFFVAFYLFDLFLKVYTGGFLKMSKNHYSIRRETGLR